MTLTAIRPSCWSGKLALNLDGKPIGAAEPRTWKGGYDVRLTGGRRLTFGKAPGSGWTSSKLALIGPDGAPLAAADRVSCWKSAWGLDLTTGPAALRPKSFWNRGQVVVPLADETEENGSGDVGDDAPPLAELDWLSRKQSGAAGGWRVAAADARLTPTDLLLIGLTYQAIRNRQAAAAAGAGAA